MKNKYIFIDENNGHLETYHPFETDAILTQEKVYELIKEINPFSFRIGSTLMTLFEALDKKGFQARPMLCPFCEQQIKSMKKPFPKDWLVVSGISGNY